MDVGIIHPSTTRWENEMVKLITWEHESSQPETREFETVAACYNLADNGGFYKAQIVDENGVIEYEFKG